MYGGSYFNYIRNRELGRTPNSVPIVRRRARPRHLTSRVVRVLRRAGGRARSSVAVRDRVQIARRGLARAYNRRHGVLGFHWSYPGSRINNRVYQ